MNRITTSLSKNVQRVAGAALLVFALSQAALMAALPRVAAAGVLMAAVMTGICDPAVAMAAGLVLSFETVAGGTLGVSTSAPSTFDIAGYSNTNLLYTLVGEITDLGGGYGRKYNTATHAAIASAQQVVKKASYTLAPVTYQMAWDLADAGQDICRTAADDQTQVLTVNVRKNSGQNAYFTAQVSEFIENLGTIDNVVVGQMTLLPQTNIVRNPA